MLHTIIHCVTLQMLHTIIHCLQLTLLRIYACQSLPEMLSQTTACFSANTLQLNTRKLYTAVDAEPELPV